MAWNWKVFCSACGSIACATACIVAAIPSGGMSIAPLMVWSAAAGGLGYLVGDKADQEAMEREKEMMKDSRYKDASDAANNQNKENDSNRNLLAEIAGKLNGSIERKPHETDEYLNSQFISIKSKLDNGEKRYNQLLSDVDKLRKQLGGNQSLATLLGLDKLGFTDKIMIVGGIVVLIWLLKK